MYPTTIVREDPSSVNSVIPGVMILPHGRQERVELTRKVLLHLSCVVEDVYRYDTHLSVWQCVNAGPVGTVCRT